MPSEDEYPTFDAGKTYWLSGETLNDLVTLIKRGRARAGAGLSEDEQGEDGTFLKIGDITSQVQDVLSSATLTATCNGDGTVTVKFSFP